MRVEGLGHIVHNGETFEVGAKFTLTKSDGDRLIRLGKAKEITKKVDTKKTDTSKKDENEDERTLEELQEEAEALGIDTKDMTRDMLIEEIDGI